MKFTTKKRLDESLIGKKVLKKNLIVDGGGESADGMRFTSSTAASYIDYGNIENEVKNPDGTYTYDYTSVTEKEYPSNRFDHDSSEMIKELLFDYNIQVFSTDLKESQHNKKDYYAKINISFEKNGLAKLEHETNHVGKTNKNYLEKSDEVDTVSMEELKDYFTSKNNYITYLAKGCFDRKVFNLGFDEIYENETVEDFLERVATSLAIPTKNIQEAIDKEEVTPDEVKQWIRDYDVGWWRLNARNFPKDIVEDMLKESTVFEKKFSDIYPDLMRKYTDDFDILEVETDELLLTDLDKILEKWNKELLFNNVYDYDKYREYIKYFERFYNDSETLKKIIPYVMNTQIPYDFEHRRFNDVALEFIRGIPKETLGKEEIRDIIFENPNNLPIERLLLWDYSHFDKGENIRESLLTDFEYDEKSAISLLNSLANSSGRYRLQTINAILDIAKQNHISSEKMSEALQKNGFDVFSSFEEEDIQKFKSFGIKGIPFSNFRDKIIQERQFNYVGLLDSVTDEEFYSVIESNGIKNEDGVIDYGYVFYLIGENSYNHFNELLSKITPGAKETVKKALIDNLDRISLLQKDEYGWNDEDRDGNLSEAMNVMNEAFEFTKNDLIKIYTKCINNGRPISSTLDNLMIYLPEEEKDAFKKETSNIYPNPKFEYWRFGNNRKYISINPKETRQTIKEKIQQDGRCFSTKIKTDMVGKSKEGKKIPVNNLSKWLFGVPGAKGQLIVQRDGYICLPKNTPTEVEKIIEESLAGRKIDDGGR